MPNPLVWFDHRSDNPSSAGKFYEELLNWKRADNSPPGMTVVGGGQRAWSGMAASETLPPGWLPYVQVNDLETSVSQAKTLGAKVLKNKTRGPAGNFVVLKDLAGGVVALWDSP